MLCVQPENPESASSSASVKRLRLRYEGSCRECGSLLSAGTKAVYDRADKTVLCLPCGDSGTVDSQGPTDPGTPLPYLDGTAGSSARREHERRKAAREERIRRNHPRIGGLLLALSDDPQSTRAWASGAAGEERLGQRLDALAGPLVRVLHDRRVPSGRANLDHLVVCPTGVLVVDAKRYRGRPRLRATGGLFTPRTETLLVGSRNCTRLVASARKQVETVRGALGDDPGVGVSSVLCFVEADWPLIGGDFHVDGVYVTWPKKLASRITQPGPLDEARIDSVHRRLLAAFPPA